MNRIFTVGHSVHKVEEFINLLKQHHITHIIDVRSVPYSRYTPQFNKEHLANVLVGDNIIYCFAGEPFGARQDDLSLYNEQGILDFEKVQKSERFNKGIAKLTQGVENGHNLCLMCSEKDPLVCHRFGLISKPLHDKGVVVNHILSDGSIKTQDELHTELLTKYKTDSLDVAYRKLNTKIGYKLPK